MPQTIPDYLRRHLLSRRGLSSPQAYVPLAYRGWDEHGAVCAVLCWFPGFDRVLCLGLLAHLSKTASRQGSEVNFK